MGQNLTSPRVVKAILKEHNVTLSRKFGQNFLVDDNILKKIVVGVNPQPEDNVLEIGPGIGTLTLPLAEMSRSVVAVEIDGRLIPVLEDTLRGLENITILPGDILKVNIHDIYAQYFSPGPMKIAANLPYYLTTPFLFKILQAGLPLASITLLVQREAARRMVAVPGTKDYGVLTLLIGYYCSASLLFQVPPSVFFPRPEVNSAVVSLKPLEKPAVMVPREDLFFNLIRAAFQQRRKTLLNALGVLRPGKKSEIQAVIAKAGFSPSVRGEELTLEQFAILNKLFYNISVNNPDTSPSNKGKGRDR